MLENGKNGVWGKFKDAWPYYCMRQEPGLGAGQPDVVVQDRLGRPGFIELKRPDAIELNPNQWIWHEMWWDGHGKTIILSCLRYGKDDIGWRVFIPKFKPRELHELASEPVPRETMLRLVGFNLGLKVR